MTNQRITHRSMTAEQIEFIRKSYVDERLSQGKIAKKMGITRNKIAGIRWRNNINRPEIIDELAPPLDLAIKTSKPEKEKQPTPSIPIMLSAKIKKAAENVGKKKPTRTIPIPIAGSTANECGLPEHGQCKFTASQKLPFTFCPEKAMNGKSYCERHAKVCFTRSYDSSARLQPKV